MVHQLIAIQLHLATLRTLERLELGGLAPTVQGVPVERDIEVVRRSFAVAVALSVPGTVASPL